MSAQDGGGCETCAHAANVALALRRIAADIRLAGDVRLVRLNEDGVAPAEFTLSDELWMNALLLDGKITPLADPDGAPDDDA